MANLPPAVPVKSLASWHSPECRSDVIQELILGVDRYNPTNLGLLEDYLSQQVRDGEHDLLANLAILKLYQFNPQLSNPDAIINILLKALSSTVHGPDYNLCLSLLREPSGIIADIESDENAFEAVMPFLGRLHELVRTCQFTTFWQELEGESEAASVLKSHYIPAHPHFYQTLRHLFSTSIASAFSAINLSQLSRWLNLSSNELQGWCESIGWTVEGEKAVIPKNGDNDVKAGVVKEHVELSQLTKLIAAAA